MWDTNYIANAGIDLNLISDHLNFPGVPGMRRWWGLTVNMAIAHTSLLAGIYKQGGSAVQAAPSAVSSGPLRIVECPFVYDWKSLAIGWKTSKVFKITLTVYV